ncbi:MAG: hypothetical protein KAT00_01880, partial [Planctomycetes bacterium]|nr:hypothetical protein [Planctomycetota bacterium]
CDLALVNGDGLDDIFHMIEIERALGNTPDINDDGGVDYGDFAVISAHFGEGCSEPEWCGGADLNVNGWVDPNDVRILGQNWMGGL